MPEEIGFTRKVNEELETDVDLGTDEDDDFRVAIGDQPIGFRLQNVFESLGKPLPSEIALYKMFDVWLIPHRISIVRRRGNAEPTSVGIQVEYLHDGSTCCVVGLMPSFEYVEHGRAAAAVKYQGKLSATGEMLPGIEASFADETSLKKFGGLSIGVTAAGEVGFQFDLRVSTPKVAAVGIGSSSCEWRLDKRDVPLFGRTLETWSTLVLPKRQSNLAYRIRYYYLSRTLFFTTRRESEPLELKCQLAKS